MPTLLRRLRGRSSSVYRARVEQKRKWKTQFKRHGSPCSPDYRGRMCWLQFVRARLSCGWLHHDDRNRQRTSTNVLETKNEQRGGSSSTSFIGTGTFS